MDKSEAKKRIKKLRSEIARLRDAYHVKNSPNATDEVYDSLTRELKKLIEQNPEFDDSHAPEQRVAGKPLEKFKKIKHKVRMLSLNDAFSEEELYDWEKRIKKLLAGIPKEIKYFCEIKFDGLAVSLIYEKGQLVTGATRGDGFVGEDITENLKMINSIPLFLPKPYPNHIEVRGEALMSKKTFSRLNVRNEKEGKILFANTRNATAGSLRQLDANLVKERHLDFYAYDIAQISGTEKLETHSDKHHYLKKLGFNVGENEAVCKNLDEARSFIKKFEKIRPDFPFGTDGIVVSVDDLRLQEILGVVGKAPRYMAAFKYPAEKATTILLDIKINVGRTGAITPLAIFRPTLVAGSTVSKATLHNMDQIERLDLRIGDTVVIEKAGDVIPKVVEVLPKLRTGKEKKFKMPAQCPACGKEVAKLKVSSGLLHPSDGTFPVQKPLTSPLSTEKMKNSASGRFHSLSGGKQQNSSSSLVSVAYYCSNPKCPAKNERYLEHFVSVFEIYELGPKILRRFKDEGLITDAADIFTLLKEDIEILERFGEKSAENIIKEIEMKKKIPLSRFLWALGILHVGEETARDLAEHFQILEHLQDAGLEEINSLENIGPAVSKSVFEFFREKNNLNFIKKLKDNGVIIQKSQNKKDGKLKGMNFVLTGTLGTLSREEAKQKIISLSGKVVGSVSKNTSYVVAGKEPGSKLKNAKKLGVKVLTEEEFIKIL